MLSPSLLIAISYFAIPITLFPIARRAKGTLRDSLILASLFIFSCGIGHLLEGFKSPYMHTWHWVTALISWVFLAALSINRKRLVNLYDSFMLLGISWEGIVAQMLFERDISRRDLKLVRINEKAKELSNYQMEIGDYLCEKLADHRYPAYPYTEPLIDMYLQTRGSQILKFRFEGGTIDSWFLTACFDLPSTNYLYITFIDISEEKVASLRDTLTGLNNRRILETEHGRWTGVMYMDLDRFKAINDNLGHAAGDFVLADVGARLLKVAKKQGGLAVRVGGDEFVFLFRGDYRRGAEIAMECSEEIRKVRLEHDHQGLPAPDKQLIDVSIGIACGKVNYFLTCEKELDRQILAADAASRKAKRNGKKSEMAKDKIVLWDDILGEQIQNEYAIEANLRDEKIVDELSLAFQPIVNMHTLEIVGAEALLRWKSPKLGFVSPAKFIPIAESSGLIFGLSAWVLQNGIRQLQTWQKVYPDFSISINVSPKELEDDDLIINISNLIKRFDIRIGTLAIEVTERGLYENKDQYMGNLAKLKAASITLVVDDFGEGQSNLQNLVAFAFGRVKIDISLVPLNKDDVGRIAVCKAIAQLSTDIGFAVVVEGVETQEQAELLKALGFVYAQGYHFHRPMTPSNLTELLAKNQN